MKKRLFIFVPIFLVAIFVIVSVTPTIAMSERISEKIFRIHIIANSDDEYDQSLKLKVRDSILQNTNELYSQCNSVEDAVNITNENIDYIKQVAQQTLAFYGCDFEVRAYVDNEFFNTRKYDSFVLPAGMYDCLKIEIGQGKGHNWWCVMYPSVCISGCINDLGDELTSNEIDMVTNKRYIAKFKTVEIYEKIKVKISNMKK